MWGERLERATGIEPATLSLGSSDSTTELRPPFRDARFYNSALLTRILNRLVMHSAAPAL